MVVAIPQILVVGLGNLPLPVTRHSIGHYIVDSLATRLGISLASERGGYAGQRDIFVGNTLVSLTLFKSKSLMNISGPSIANMCRRTVKHPSSMIVISDSLSHKVATLSPRLGGSANGHNGIKSIVSALGGDLNFYRFRAGIGRDQSDAANYVMGRLSAFERQFWSNQGLDLVLNEIEKVALNQCG